MSVSAKMQKSSGKPSGNYKAAWRRLLELRGQSGAAAHERARLLVAVFEDQDFRIDNGAADDIKAAEVLDDLVDDLGVQFFELRALLEFYPKIEDWKLGRLRTMRNKMRDAKAEERKAQRPEPVTRQRAKVSDLEAAREEAKRERTRAVFLKEQSEANAAKAETLEQEVARLRLENATLKGRITELERILKRELEPAAA